MKNRWLKSWVRAVLLVALAAAPVRVTAAPLAEGDVIKLDLGSAGDTDGNPGVLADWNQVNGGANASVPAGSVIRHGDGAVVDGVGMLVVGGNGSNTTGQNNDVNAAGWSGLATDPWYNDEALTDLVFGFNPNSLAVTVSGLDPELRITARVYALINEAARDVTISVTDGVATRSMGPINRQALFNEVPLSSNLIFTAVASDASGELTLEVSSANFGVTLSAVVLEVGTPVEITKTVTLSEAGRDVSGVSYLQFETELGQHYEIQASTNLLAGWMAAQLVAGDGTSYAWTNDTPWVAGPLYFRVCRVDAPPGGALTSGPLVVRQTWSQELGGFDRTAEVLVPAGAGPFPVVIMLHGSGGSSTYIGSMGNRLNGVIRVAPNGYLNTWNVSGETSKAPDVDYMRELIAALKAYANVDAGDISLMGSSNGAGLVNRCLIELETGVFHKGVTLSTQMLTAMYNSGSFWYNASGSNAYDQMIVPATGRRICAISGEADPTIPYLGGSGVGTTFMPALDSIYRFAQAQGHAGAQLEYADGIPGDGLSRPADIVMYPYLSGDVVHYRVIGGNHGLAPFANEAKDIAADFLLQ